MQLEDLLPREVRDTIRAPIERALTLPAKCYTDDGFYQLEIEAIYQKNWVACLFEAEVPEPGDVLPFDIGEMPLIAVRGMDRVLRVFHNVCAYDGCEIVLERATNQEKLTSPYHGWTFDLEGKLIETPYWDGTPQGNSDFLAHMEVDLIAVSCETYLGAVFVNLSEQHQPFSEYIAPLIRSLDEYGLEKLGSSVVNGALQTAACSANTNWKTFFENKCINVLHENFVHAAYAISQEVPRLSGEKQRAWKDLIDENYLALEFRKSDFLNTYPPFGLRHIGKEPELAPERTMFGTLYPNFYVSVFPEFIMIGFALPNGPAQTTMRYTFLTNCSEEGSDHHEQVQMLTGMFNEANEEDGRIIESVQRARKSPVYRQHFYAPFWDKMHHHFNKMILNDLEKVSE
jgi:choline monooxygenase